MCFAYLGEPQDSNRKEAMSSSLEEVKDYAGILLDDTSYYGSSFDISVEESNKKTDANERSLEVDVCVLDRSEGMLMLLFQVQNYWNT